MEYPLADVILRVLDEATPSSCPNITLDSALDTRFCVFPKDWTQETLGNY